jgi:sarcosine oxidase, subunit alpha
LPDIREASELKPRSLVGAAMLAGRCAIASSFRLHRPRGAFCHSGWCQQCRIATPDGPRLACRLAENSHPLPQILDPLRPVGLLAKAVRPWFHEVPLPAFLNLLFLGCIRRLSGAPAPPERSIAFARTGERQQCAEDCHTLIVGGGLAGLQAARVLTAAERSVVVAEVEQLGGRARFDPACRTAVASAIDEARQAGARLREGTLVAGIYDHPRRALLTDGSGTTLLHFERIVIASGSYDRLPAFIGNDLPGVISGSALVRFSAMGALAPSVKIVLAGPVHETARIDRIVRANGLKLLQTTEVVPQAVAEKGKLREISFRNGLKVSADLLAICWRQPAYELALQAGCDITLLGDPPVVIPIGRPSLPLLLTGSAAGQPSCEEVGERPLVPPDLAFEHAVKSGFAFAPAPDERAMVCLCEDVRIGDLERAILDGYDEIETLKRRTGAATGPCQGKLCHGEIAACLGRHGKHIAVPTQRPFVRPVMLADLANLAS